MSLTQIVLAVNIGKMGIPDVNLQELNIKSSMILHSTSTIEITSYKDLEEKMKTQQKIFMNRELSWLKFNERVLEEAENKEVPLCERLTFASIYQSNLDEFFMVRVGSLIDQMLLDKNMKENKTKMTPQEQIDAIIPQVQKLNRRKDIVYEEMMDSLKEHNIHLVNFQKISKKESEYLRAYFQAEIAPLISPTIIGKRQPFPFLKNKEIYAVAVLETKNGKEKLGIIPCGNETFDRLINIPGKDAYMLSEEMILHYVPRIFKGYHVKAKTLIRITRNADIDADSMYDEDLDYRDFMVELIKKRKKLAPVRMELSREMDGEIIDLLCDYLELERKYVFYTQTPLDLSFVFNIQDILRRETDLFFEKRVPQRSPQFKEEMPIMDQIEKEDKLLSYPYESMRPFLKMLQEAAEDKDVVSIKMTLYRVAKQSKIIESLIEAAENGKDVTILVELKARFDEENNIEWSRQLENAGCRVIYGLDGYKVHSKLCLITRKKKGKVSYITQIGTGNYNEKTSRLYTDLSLMTASEEIGHDASVFFHNMATFNLQGTYDHLLVAPSSLQDGIIKRIEREKMKAESFQPCGIHLTLPFSTLLTERILLFPCFLLSRKGCQTEELSSAKPQERKSFPKKWEGLSFTRAATDAPRLKASIPSCPEPAKRSSTLAPGTSNCMILKTDSLTWSVVGRTSSPSRVLSFIPLAVPVITLIIKLRVST